MRNRILTIVVLAGSAMGLAGNTHGAPRGVGQTTGGGGAMGTGFPMGTPRLVYGGMGPGAIINSSVAAHKAPAGSVGGWRKPAPGAPSRNKDGVILRY